MPDSSSILLLHSLRVALDSLNKDPDLDRRYSGIRKLKSALQEEIEELEPEVRLTIEHMPQPSVGVPM